MRWILSLPAADAVIFCNGRSETSSPTARGGPWPSARPMLALQQYGNGGLLWLGVKPLSRNARCLASCTRCSSATRARSFCMYSGLMVGGTNCPSSARLSARLGLNILLNSAWSSLEYGDGPQPLMHQKKSLNVSSMPMRMSMRSPFSTMPGGTVPPTARICCLSSSSVSDHGSTPSSGKTVSSLSLASWRSNSSKFRSTPPDTVCLRKTRSSSLIAPFSTRIFCVVRSIRCWAICSSVRVWASSTPNQDSSRSAPESTRNRATICAFVSSRRW
mmetsp:Transcript_70409/g.198742  ORF Transcript_70409/g.198742 Transcript_70409/m.198742 type:complete len:274 (-) Transcript_70409:599-1420(-)